MAPRTRNRRSLMVFSALAVDRHDELMASGADLIAFDLEDGTASDRKDEARVVAVPREERELAAEGRVDVDDVRGQVRNCAGNGREHAEVHRSAS